MLSYNIDGLTQWTSAVDWGNAAEEDISLPLSLLSFAREDLSQCDKPIVKM